MICIVIFAKSLVGLSESLPPNDATESLFGIVNGTLGDDPMKQCLPMTYSVSFLSTSHGSSDEEASSGLLFNVLGIVAEDLVDVDLTQKGDERPSDYLRIRKVKNSSGYSQHVDDDF